MMRHSVVKSLMIFFLFFICFNAQGAENLTAYCFSVN